MDHCTSLARDGHVMYLGGLAGHPYCKNTLKGGTKVAETTGSLAQTEVLCTWN